jgi:hypothetical protein
MHDFEDMVNEVAGLLNKETQKEIKKEFVNTPKDKLVMYHGTLGRTIRNEYKLWDTNWTPDIRDGVDYSPDHPDQVSMRVLEEVWERLKNG